MNLSIFVFSFFFLLGCNNYLNIKKNTIKKSFVDKNYVREKIYYWNTFIKMASTKYNVDEKLIKSIIYVESSGNPYAKSISNAIGLMQIKPTSAGLEIYRLNGKKNKPSVQELYNPKVNINIGVSYINLLEKKNLIGIKNKKIMQLAIILSYVNGTSAFLKIFSPIHKKAIKIINNMTVKNFYKNIKKHPSIQAINYLDKVIKIYNLV